MGQDDSSFVSFEKIVSDLDANNDYFLSIFKNKGFDMGLLRLRKGEIDNQEPHSVDEIYFVIEGTGYIHHRFVGGNKDLIVLYFFGCS
jgi:mannose-6-phosphate isomerase-like protein (cupin superfamily)